MILNNPKNDIRIRWSGQIMFYDVDTQYDFIYKDGALPVPGASHIIPNLEKLTNYARKDEYILIAGSVDRHFEGDEELEKNGGPFPEHCMDDTLGQKKIKVTNPVCPAYIPNERMHSSRLENIFIGDKREIFFEKQHYDVFTNPNAEKILEIPSFAVVYGVATDYCVKAAVLGMLELQREVFVVTDAIAGISPVDCDKALRKMKGAGARLITTEKVLNGAVENYARASFGVYS